MKKEARKGALDTIVEIIDWTPINEKISKAVGFPVECRIGNGLIRDIESVFEEKYGVQKRSMVIDRECCGVSTEVENIFSSDLYDGKPFAICLLKGLGFFKSKDEEGNKIIAMMPSFYFDIDIDDVNNCLTGEKVSLFEFMGERYGYNPRIVSNETTILSHVYHNDIMEGSKDWEAKVKTEKYVSNG